MRQYQSTTTKNRFGLAKLGSKFAMRILMVTLLLSVVLPAYGSIIFFSGDVTVVSPPASLLPGALTSNTAIYGFSEQQGVLLSGTASTKPGRQFFSENTAQGAVVAFFFAIQHRQIALGMRQAFELAPHGAERARGPDRAWDLRCGARWPPGRRRLPRNPPAASASAQRPAAAGGTTWLIGP
jgi:hypothetical protein